MSRSTKQSHEGDWKLDSLYGNISEHHHILQEVPDHLLILILLW